MNPFLRVLLVFVAVLATACGAKDFNDAGTTTDIGVSATDVVLPADTGTVTPDVAAAGCMSDRTCSASNEVCDLVHGVCVQCNVSADCGDAGTICMAHRCTSVTTCTTSRECPGQVCSTTMGYCVDCNTDVDCTGGQICTNSACVAPPTPCSSSRQCSAMGLVCDLAMGHCVQCAADTDCSAGQFCGTDDTCHAQVCVPATQSCPDPMHQAVCDARGASQTTVACSSGTACVGTLCQPVICVPGTMDCADMTTQRICNANGIAYTTNTCPTMQVCVGGSCLPETCTPGMATCSSSTALQTCNADGRDYTTTTCVSPAHANGTCNAGLCGITCVSGYADCDHTPSDGCEVSTGTDPLNCGTCGHACPGGMVCTGGACGCAIGTTLCGSACTDVTSDSSNCGSCGHACATGQHCVTSVCSTMRFTGVTGTTWQTETNSPEYSGISAMTGGNGYSDYTPAGQSTFFSVYYNTLEVYNITANSWSSLAAPPILIDQYSTMAWSGGSLYTINDGAVYIYNIAGNTWTTGPSVLNDTLSEAMTTHDASGNVYAVATDGRVVKYNIATNTVTYLTTTAISSPLPVVHEPRITFDPISGLLYIAPTYSETNFFSVNPTTGATLNLPSIPDTQMNDIFCGDRSGHIYAAGAISGTNMWQYTIATATWAPVPATPIDHGNQGSCTVTDSGYLYITSGEGAAASLPLM